MLQQGKATVDREVSQGRKHDISGSAASICISCLQTVHRVNQWSISKGFVCFCCQSETHASLNIHASATVQAGKHDLFADCWFKRINEHFLCLMTVFWSSRKYFGVIDTLPQQLLKDITNWKLTHPDRLLWTPEGCSPAPGGNKRDRWYWVVHTSHQNQHSPGPLCFGCLAVKIWLMACSCGSHIEGRWTYCIYPYMYMCMSFNIIINSAEHIPLFSPPVSCVSESFGKGIVVNF